MKKLEVKKLEVRPLHCKVYNDLMEWVGDVDKNLIQFFAALLERRNKLGKCLQAPDGGDTTIVGADCVLSEDMISQSEDDIL